MKTRLLQKGSLSLPVLTLGTWQLADTQYWGPGGRPEETVRAALDQGITSFDCAEMYADGESERVLGRALGPDRARALILTKVSQEHASPEAVCSACENSLRRLGTDVIDLYQVHWPNRTIPFAETYGALERLRQEGKIREIGVSNFGPRDLADWTRSGRAASNQVCYNLLFRAIEHDIVPACRAQDMSILAYSPVMQGLLCGRWDTIDAIPETRRRTRHFSGARDGTRHGETGCEALTLRALHGIADLARAAGMPMGDLALAWLLARPGVASVIVGGRQPEQVAANARAAAIELDPVLVARLDALTDPLKDALGPNADPWLPGDRSRVR
jgi:myo-inositol catabolism protein IolS